MKLQDIKSKIKSEDFETVCLLVYEAVVENKITQDQFIGLMYEITEEFEGETELDSEDDFNESFDEDKDFFSDDEEFDENY